MKKLLIRYSLLVLLLVILTGVFIGYDMWSKPHMDIKDADAYKTTADSLYIILSNDSSQLKVKLMNTIVAVMGIVKEVAVNQQHQQIVLLKTHIPDGSLNCTMEEKINDIKIGNTVVIKGICSGYAGGEAEMNLAGDVFLIRCYEYKTVSHDR